MKIRVLMPFVKSGTGGSYISASLLAKALAELDVDVTAIFPHEGPAPDYFRKDSVKVEIGNYAEHKPLLSYQSRVWKILSTVIRNLRILHFAYFYLQKSDVEIVHCNDDNSIIPWGCAAKLTGKKVVWHVRHGDPARLDRIRKIMADIAIYISAFATSRSSDVSKKITIYDPIQVIQTEVESKVQYDDAETLKLIHMGRDKPYKRIEWTVEALRRLLERGYNVELEILGDFSDVRMKELLAKFSDQQRNAVKFRGWVENPEVYLAQSDILLHPAYGETFGRVFVEAHSHGVPVLASMSGAAPEVVENGVTGLLADSGSLDDYCDKLELLAGDRKIIEKMARNCRRNAERFTPEAHAKAVLDVYLSVTEG